MSRYFYPGHKHNRNEQWADRVKGSFPFHLPNPYQRFDGVEKKSICVQEGNLYAGDTWKPGDFVPSSLFVTKSLVDSGHYLDWAELMQWKNQKAVVHNKTISKMDDNLAQVANLFEDWYERKQSYALLMTAGKELLRFATGWRKPSYWKSVGVKAKTPSSLPEAWITYQFGVKPLVGFVDTALNNLGRPLQDAKFAESSSTSFQFGTYEPSSSKYKLFTKYDVKYRKTLGCFVASNPNPNVGLINIAGLGMPFSTVWNVLPWGWAVDYFVNVSEMLSNFESKHPGVNVHNWWTTEKWDIDFEQKLQMGDGLVVYFDRTISHMVRSTNVSTPNYQLAFDFPLLGSNKAANLFSAIALTLKK